LSWLVGVAAVSVVGTTRAVAAAVQAAFFKANYPLRQARFLFLSVLAGHREPTQPVQ
jgi:hypothetical protein